MVFPCFFPLGIPKPLHRSDLKISGKSRHNFGKNELIHDSIHSNFRNFGITTAVLLLNIDEFFSEFHRCERKCQNSLRIAEKLQKIVKFS